MSFIIDPPAVAAVPVAGQSHLFPVHRIYCVGRNYVEHAQEMGHSGREAPFFFLKPADTLLPAKSGQAVDMHYPGLTSNLHHEVELVIAIGMAGKDIAVEDAMAYVWGYAVGLDMTRRDLQGEAKKQGRPWDIGKGFEESAPIGEILPAAQVFDIDQAAIWLDVNGQRRQQGSIEQLIWNIPEIIAAISRAWTLQPGDLIFTGTPAGVGAVVQGDALVAHVDGLPELAVKII
ncbi:Fumarylpyruvate hydrolase [Saezia sanguinis]|uniref:Fumarylpyruvate hydrolase n=1 Tax=Saezia sanguinis TaxID=1965230 RepID=A0A433SHE0_9BURK|nr:fumarylacetoacetate hydrolase family protein [Saezia sanguinis]RUS68153.1 Fumarylpyruvate hydrolase [Saezia sanguinis]